MYFQIMKIILLFAMILPLALSTSKIVEMQVHTQEPIPDLESNLMVKS